MIKQYRNEEWLRNKYWEEELRQKQIAKLCGIDRKTIQKWMKKLNIPRRSRSGANQGQVSWNKGRSVPEETKKKIGKASHLALGNHCKLSGEAIEWLNGELLGDGTLYSYNSYSARFQYGSKFLEHIQYVKNTLNSFGIRGGKIYKYHYKNCDCYYYSTFFYEELLPLYKKWYLDPDRKKIVPKDIKLTPLTLRQEYIGDGCLSLQKRRSHIILSTNGFTIADVKWLIKELINLGFKATRQLSNNVIRISVHSTKEFLEYIGSCPVECYQYKWNYQDNRGILA